MSEGTDPRFDERQVALILKRASELQTRTLEPGSGRGGFSLSELEDIAREAGIDVRHVRAAAFEVQRAPLSGLGERLAGGRVRVRIERRVAGELDEEEFEPLIPEIQMAADAHGTASQIGRTLTWRSGGAQNQRSLQVTVSSRDGETRIVAEERLHGTAGAVFGGVLGGVGAGLGFGVGMPVGLAIGPAAAVALPAVVVVGTYVAARSFFGSLSRKRERVLTALADGIARYVDEHSRSDPPTAE